MILELLTVVARHDPTIAARLFQLQDSTTMKITYGEKRISGDIMGGAWQRYVTLEDGRIFNVSVSRGRSVRIAFARRGENRGFQWWAYCSQCEHKDGDRWPTMVKRYPVVQCKKSTGVRGILNHHEIIN